MLSQPYNYNQNFAASVYYSGWVGYNDDFVDDDDVGVRLALRINLAS